MSTERGFTVLDLLVAFAIIGLLLTVGLPALTTMAFDSRMNAQTNGLVHALHRARQEAHLRRREAVICPLGRQGRCDAAGDWSRGWLLIVQDTAPVGSAKNTLHTLMRADTFEGIRLRANRKAFTFRPFGIRATNGTFWLCDRRGGARAVVVSPAGRPRTIAGGQSAAGERACEA